MDDNPAIDRSSLTPAGISTLREEFVSAGVSTFRDNPDLSVEEWTATASDGAPLAMTTIRPARSREPQAAIFHIHSGGMIAGDRFIGLDLMAEWVIRHDLVCASVEYRLAPEHPFPTPLNDCYDGLLAFVETLTTDTPLLVAGMSAGGGLSAGVSLRARDEHGPEIAGQLLMCPMLDYRNDSASSQQFRNLGLWDHGSNTTGWDAYLGPQWRDRSVSAYASPSHASTLTGLPPTFLDVGALEVFRSEIVDFAERLAIADVPVELHLWAGAFHGFDLTHPAASVSGEAMAAREQWLTRLLAGHFS